MVIFIKQKPRPISTQSNFNLDLINIKNMTNPLDNFEIIEVKQGELEAGMILAENFFYKGSQTQREALKIGVELNNHSAGRLNNLANHREILREEGKSMGDSIKVFKKTNGTGNWIEALRNDMLIRETLTEGVVRRYREEGASVISDISDKTKPLIKEVLERQITLSNLITEKSKSHKVLEELLTSPQFKEDIEKKILEPLSRKPIIGTYLSYAPNTIEHSLDVTTLAVRLAFEVGLTIEDIYDIAIASTLHDIGIDYLLARFKGKENPSPEIMELHGIYFVEKILTLGEKKIPIDGLTDQQVKIMKHHHTRRDGLGSKEPSADKHGVVYIGKDITYNTDTPELLIKAAEWKKISQSKDPKSPSVQECPVIFNEIVYLAERWITGIERNETNRLEAARLLKSMEEESGLCARTQYIEPFLKILGKSYFNH